MAERPSTAHTLINEWDVSSYIASRQWDLVSPLQTRVPGRSNIAEDQSTLSVLLPSQWKGGLLGGTSSPPTHLLSQSSASMLGVLESLRCGGFLLNSGGRVLSLNRVAFGCLGDGLLLCGERLTAADRTTDRQLQTVIASALTGQSDPTPFPAVVIQRHCRVPLLLRVIRPDHGEQPTPTWPGLLLLALDPGRRCEPSRAIMAQAFGLTSVEAEIAIGVGSGKTLAEIADEHAMKVGTVRAYSKRVFSKTYTRGQPELAALVTRLTFVVPQARVESGRTARRNLLGGETADLRLDAPRYKRQSAQQGGVEQP